MHMTDKMVVVDPRVHAALKTESAIRSLKEGRGVSIKEIAAEILIKALNLDLSKDAPVA
jgi:hypothetical protein